MFHRVDDWRTLDGPRFFRLALRLTAYAGVLQARAVEERERSEGRGGSPASSHTAPASHRPDRPARVDDGAALAMLADGWVEHITEE